MDDTTASGAAAALLLRPVAPDPGLRRLTAVASSLGFGGWLGPATAAEVDGELVYCLADVLRARAEQDPAWGAELGTLVAERPHAGEALEDLAQDLRRRSQWGAADWCRERLDELRPGARAAVPMPDREEAWLEDWLAAAS